MTRFLREPLLHFFLIGAVVFALFAVFDDAPPAVQKQTITVTPEDAMRLIAEFETTWRRRPSAAELDSLMDSLVREEVYVREAIALGLDDNDPIIRRRLQQKMEFLTESGAEAVAPEDAVLEAHLAENADRFARPAVIAFQQILLRDDIDDTRIADIASRLDAGKDVPEAWQPSLLPDRLPASPLQVVDSTFGTGFFQSVLELPLGTWSGPVASTFGKHLVHLEERVEGALPSLESIRERVELDWRANFAAELRERRFDALRSRYRISRPDTRDILGE